MSFRIAKVSNHGTSNPIVARLAVQTHELIQWAALPHKQREAVCGIYDGLKNRLLKCYEVFSRLDESLQEQDKDYDDLSFKHSHPFVIGLEGEAQTFLYEAKNFLRDLLPVMDAFFGTDFDEASDLYNPRGTGRGVVVKWAMATFGTNHPFTAMLVADQEWIAELIRKRNAAEHPGERSGTLYVENCKPASDGRFIVPSWWRDTNPATGVLPDLAAYLHNLLTLAEEVLLHCINEKKTTALVGFVEIPDTDRDPQRPIRFRVGFNEAAVQQP